MKNTLNCLKESSKDKNVLHTSDMTSRGLELIGVIDKHNNMVNVVK